MAETLDEEQQVVDASETLDDDAGHQPGDEASGAAATDSQAGAPSGTEGEPRVGEEGDDEPLFQFGDEAPPASDGQERESAPQWVKDLRKQNAELTRRLRTYEAQEKTQQQPVQVPTLGPKPQLADFDYDETKFDSAVEKWYDTKRQIDSAKSEAEAHARARQEVAQARLSGYQQEARTLRVKDFQEVESDVVGALSVEQQGILLAGADKPGALVYALGKHPAKLRQLAQITDPVRFAFAAAKLEKDLKMTTRNANKPAPEGRVSSSSAAPAAGGGEKKLEQLRAEAEKTGDYSKVVAYKAQLKQAQQRR